jgi:hypothetical protein
MSQELLGRRVRLVVMRDAYTDLKPGALGTINFVDDFATLFVKWDSGSGLGLVPGIDEWEVLPTVEEIQATVGEMLLSWVRDATPNAIERDALSLLIRGNLSALLFEAFKTTWGPQ